MFVIYIVDGNLVVWLRICTCFFCWIIC